MVIDLYKGNGTRDSVQILFSDVTIQTFYCCYLDRKNLRRAKVISCISTKIQNLFFIFLVTKEYRYRKSMTAFAKHFAVDDQNHQAFAGSFPFVISKGVKNRYSRAPEGTSQLRVTIGLRENREGLPVYQAKTIFFSQLDIFRKFGGGTNRRLRRVDREDRSFQWTNTTICQVRPQG